MEQARPAAARNSLFFDSVCGASVSLQGANQLFDGDRTYYFCSAYCRRLFLDQRYALQAAGLSARRPPGSVSLGRSRSRAGHRRAGSLA